MDKEEVVCVCVCVYIYTHTCMYTYRHTLEYYPAIKKREILPFAMMWMELEGIMLNEISQRKTPYDFTHVEFKKQNR